MYKNAWTNSDKYSYYSTSDGSLAVGLTWVGTKRYNFDKNGAMYKNAWTNSDKYSYYSTSDGSLAVGLTWVGTKRYNFDKMVPCTRILGQAAINIHIIVHQMAH